MKRRMVSELTLLLTLVLLMTMLLMTIVPISHAQEPTWGGTMVVAVAEIYKDLGAFTTNHMYVYVHSMFNGLLTYGFDMSIHPELAESWEISADGKAYTFHLVRNATFHDGYPLTSADVKYTIENLTRKYHPAGAKILQYLDHVETPDNYTVVVKLTQPFAPLIYCFGAFYMCIYPKHLYEGTDYLTNEHTTTHPIGTGAFKFQEYVPLDHITLIRNENYWKKPLPYLDKIIVKYVTDPQVMTLGLLSGEIDVATHPPFATLAQLVQGGVIVDYRAATANPENGYIYLNLRPEAIPDHNPALSSKKVRQAISYAIDRGEINEKAWGGGKLKPCYGCIPPSMTWCYNANLNHYDQDVAKANALLDEAGYPRGQDGIRFELTSVQYPRDERVRTMEIIKEHLKAVGIKLNLQILDSPTMSDKVFVRHEFDMMICSIGSGPDPVIGVARILTTASITNTPYQNAGAYSNPEVDRLFDEVAAETNTTKRAEIFREIQEITNDDCPGIWFGEQVFPTAFSRNLHGQPEGPFNHADPYDKVWWEGMHHVSPSEAADTISNAEKTITDLEKQNYTVSAARAKLTEANAALNRLDYTSAKSLAELAPGLVTTSEVTPPPSEPPYMLWTGILIAVGIIVSVVAVYQVRKGKRK